MATESDDEYGLDSADEADLIASFDSLPELTTGTKQKVTPTDADEYGLSPADDADLVATFDSPQKHNLGTKRKNPPTDEDHVTKKPQTREYPTTSSLAVTTLKKVFGFSRYRLKQEAAIARILAGGSAVVVFPTGGGKSLCYQIPALAFEALDKVQGIRDPAEHGITIVVSPLLALMKDQVDVLVRLGVAAATMDSGKSRAEYLKTCDQLRDGSLRILYVAPERLNNEGFMEQMKRVRGGVRLVAVDEAHCISEWGHAFRPDYLKVSRFADEIKAERVICLTATATPRVAEDICKAFNIGEGGLFRTTTYRPNLRLIAESSNDKHVLYDKLYSFLRKNPGPSIIYVTLQKQTEALAEDLVDQGFMARSFHAGMATADKIKLQEDFMTEDNLTIVATIAFGMGIDKPNVRNVVHFNIPNSVESYSQEIGRAGRDGKLSNCLFYVCGQDLYLREVFARGDLPSKESLKKLLNDIFCPANSQLAVGKTFEVSHLAQGKEFDIRANTLSNVYAQLELRYGLIRATTPIYTDYSYKACGSYGQVLKEDSSAAAAAIKAFSQIGRSIYKIDINAAAISGKISRPDLIHKLNDWNELQHIELKVSGVRNVYRVDKELPSVPPEVEKIADDLYAYMEEREQQALDRTEQVLSFITASHCFCKALAQHFGDELPDGKTECGHCTWCETRTPVSKPIMPKVEFNAQQFERVLAAVPDRHDPRLLARVAFGITSPRVTALKLQRDGPDAIFGSMADHGFETLLRAFGAVCTKENRNSSNSQQAPAQRGRVKKPFQRYHTR